MNTETDNYEEARELLDHLSRHAYDSEFIKTVGGNKAFTKLWNKAFANFYRLNTK